MPTRSLLRATHAAHKRPANVTPFDIIINKAYCPRKTGQIRRGRCVFPL